MKVRARLSRPLQRGRGKRVSRGDFRITRAPIRDSRPSWSRGTAHRLPLRASRGSIGRGAPVGVRGVPVGGRGPKRPIGLRDRRAVPAFSDRTRHLPPPERPYSRRPSSMLLLFFYIYPLSIFLELIIFFFTFMRTVPVYPKSISKRDYARRDELTHRSRTMTEYGSRIPIERRSSYEDDYSRGGGYSDIPRTMSRSTERRPYVDEGYGRKLERALPSYREGRSRDYDSISGSKRPYSALVAKHLQNFLPCPIYLTGHFLFTV